MNMEIKKIPFSRLLKLELPSVAKLVMEIVEKHDPEELHIKEVFDLLVEEEPQIKALNALYGVHPLTLKLKPEREKLKLYISALRLQLKVASKMSTPGIQQSAVITQLAFDAHLGGIRLSKNEKIIHEKIGEFLDEVNRNAELQGAIEDLGLTPLTDNLQSTQTIVRELLAERLSLKSLRPKDKTKELAYSLETALKNLFKQIEVAQLKNKLVSYKPIIDELNDTINVFRNLVNIREANNKRKAEEKKAMEDGEIVDEGDESTEEPGVMGMPRMFVAPATGGFVPEVEGHSSNGSGDDLDQSLDQKKTVAPSTKQTQLPSSKNEDLNTNTLN